MDVTMKKKTVKRGPGRPPKERNLYRVRAKRVLSFPATHGGLIVWAREGAIVRIDHEVIRRYAEGQYHKLDKLDGLPAGCTVSEELPQRIQREIEEFDRRADRGDASMPGVSRPQRELQDKVDALERENAALAKQNAEFAERLKALEEK